MKDVKPYLSFDLRLETYSRILSVHLDNDDIRSSWVVLLSSTYQKIHAVQLSSLFTEA